jgi:hypothetical protein
MAAASSPGRGRAAIASAPEPSGAAWRREEGVGPGLPSFAPRTAVTKKPVESPAVDPSSAWFCARPAVAATTTRLSTVRCEMSRVGRLLAVMRR